MSNCNKDQQQLSIQGDLICIENANCIRLNVIRDTKLVGFAGAYISETSTGTNASNLTVEYSFNTTSVTAVGALGGAGNDQRHYDIVFDTPHPNGSDYIITVSKPSDEPNGDERKIQWSSGSKTPNGFSIKFSIDDNGATEDQQVFNGFDFIVHEELEFIKSVSLSEV